MKYHTVQGDCLRNIVAFEPFCNITYSSVPQMLICDGRKMLLHVLVVPWCSLLLGEISGSKRSEGIREFRMYHRVSWRTDDGHLHSCSNDFPLWFGVPVTELIKSRWTNLAYYAEAQVSPTLALLLDYDRNRLRRATLRAMEGHLTHSTYYFLIPGIEAPKFCLVDILVFALQVPVECVVWLIKDRSEAASHLQQ